MGRVRCASAGPPFLLTQQPERVWKSSQLLTDFVDGKGVRAGRPAELAPVPRAGGQDGRIEGRRRNLLPIPTHLTNSSLEEKLWTRTIPGVIWAHPQLGLSV